MTHTAYRDLKKYCYFSSLSDGALEVLSKKLQVIECPSGTEIIKEGTPADGFYFISKGYVYNALKEFGAPLTEIDKDTFCEEGIVFQIGVAPRPGSAELQYWARI